jgi:hypothetical protein
VIKLGLVNVNKGNASDTICKWMEAERNETRTYVDGYLASWPFMAVPDVFAATHAVHTHEPYTTQQLHGTTYSKSSLNK